MLFTSNRKQQFCTTLRLFEVGPWILDFNASKAAISSISVVIWTTAESRRMFFFTGKVASSVIKKIDGYKKTNHVQAAMKTWESILLMEIGRAHV